VGWLARRVALSRVRVPGGVWVGEGEGRNGKSCLSDLALVPPKSIPVADNKLCFSLND